MTTLKARELSREAGLAGPDERGAGIRFVGLCLTFALFAYLGLAFDSTPMWIAVAFINGLVLFGFAIGGHEAVHGSLSSNRTVNDLAGIVWMALILLPFGTYKRMHLEHHAWVNTDKDPEGNIVYKNLLSFVLLSAFFGAGFIVLVWAHTVQAAVGKSPYVRTARQRNRIAVHGFLSFLVAAALLSSTVMFEPMRWLWFAPMLTGVFWWAPLILTPEHYALGPGDPAATSRTTTSNRIVRALLWNVDYHTAHHLAPAVPARHLPAFNELLGDNATPEKTSGYLRFQLDILRGLLAGKPMLIPDEPATTTA